MAEKNDLSGNSGRGISDRGMFMRKASYEYIGIGTWIAGIIYFIFKDHKETLAFLSGLIILHSGIVLLLIEKLSSQELLGFIVFTVGVIGY